MYIGEALSYFFLYIEARIHFLNKNVAFHRAASTVITVRHAVSSTSARWIVSPLLNIL